MAKRADPATRDHDIAGVLARLRVLVRALEDSSRELFLDYGLTAPQLWVLRALAGGPRTAGNLARELAVHPSTLTALAERLEQRGLVSRERGRDDRRYVRLRLSPAGGRLASRVPPTPQGRLVRALHGMPAARIRRLSDGLYDLVRALEARETPPTPIFSRLGR
jgi:DNA-binding MarR family transcriptional regulator